MYKVCLAFRKYQKQFKLRFTTEEREHFCLELLPGSEGLQHRAMQWRDKAPCCKAIDANTEDLEGSYSIPMARRAPGCQLVSLCFARIVCLVMLRNCQWNAWTSWGNCSSLSISTLQLFQMKKMIETVGTHVFLSKTLAAQVLISMGQDKQNAREASLQLPEMGRHKKDNLKKEKKTNRQ